MKILVSGALGNIGTILGNKLQKNNIPFIGLDIANQGFTSDDFFQLDITNKSNLHEKKSVFNEVDTLIHLVSKIDAGADCYITGTSWAQSHLRTEEFKKSNIPVEFQKFQHPIYTQIHGKFIPEMSIIDLLFNEGREGAKKILQNSVVSSS